MSNQPATTVTNSGNIITGYRVLASLIAILVIVQAFLGIRGQYADPGLVTMHEMLANAMFLLVVIQVVLAWMLYSKKLVTVWVVVLNVALLLLTVGQIGLGYSTRDADSFATTISLHIPNGVLLMGVETVVATMAWRIVSADRISPPTAA